MAVKPAPQMTREEIRKHNGEVLSQAKPGDLLQFDRGAYCHWAVYTGEGRVIHLAGIDGDLGQMSQDNVMVRKEDFWRVAKNSPTRINNDKDSRLEPLKSEDIVKRARSNLGQTGYNIAFFNCEHFCSWCRYGKIQSDQVDNFVETGAKLFGPSGIYITKAYDFLKNLSVAGSDEKKTEES